MITSLAPRLLGAAMALFCTLARADAGFHVELDTSLLAGSPFALLLEFTDGSANNDANNAVRVSDLQLGPLLGAPTLFGGTSLLADGSVSFVDSHFVNTWQQGFTAGSRLTFDVRLGTAVDAAGPVDEFSVFVLQPNGQPIPTGDFGSALLLIDIDGLHPQPLAFGGSGSYAALPAPVVTSLPVPEPDTWMLFLTGLIFLGSHRYHLRTKP